VGLVGGLLAGLLVDVLLFGAFHKLLAHTSFTEALHDYRALRRIGTERAVLGLAVVVPLAEFVAGVTLIFPSTRVGGSIGALVLLAAFSALIVNDDRAVFTNCGCGGASGGDIPMPRRAFVVRNSLILPAAVVMVALTVAGAGLDATAGDVVLYAALALPLSQILMNLPLVLHIVEVDRQRLPDRVSAAKQRIALQSEATVRV
jgi:hypothetical protein